MKAAKSSEMARKLASSRWLAFLILIFIPLAVLVYAIWVTVPHEIVGAIAATALLAASVGTVIWLVRQANRSFGVLGDQGPTGLVVRGIKIIAVDVLIIPIAIMGSRIYDAVSGQPPPIEIRTGIFWICFIMVPVAFGTMSLGFKRHADGILRMRRHWAFEHGFHAPGLAGDNPAKGNSLLRRISKWPHADQ